MPSEKKEEVFFELLDIKPHNPHEDVVSRIEVSTVAIPAEQNSPSSYVRNHNEIQGQLWSNEWTAEDDMGAPESSILGTELGDPLEWVSISGGLAESEPLVEALRDVVKEVEFAVSSVSLLTSAKHWILGGRLGLSSTAYQGAVLVLLRESSAILELHFDERLQAVKAIQTAFESTTSVLGTEFRSQIVKMKPDIIFQRIDQSETTKRFAQMLQKSSHFLPSSCWSSPLDDFPERGKEVLETENTRDAYNLFLHTVGPITALGASSIGCPKFSNLLEDETGKILVKFVESSGGPQAVFRVCQRTGLIKIFLKSFGGRAAAIGGLRSEGRRKKTKYERSPQNEEEIRFWIQILENVLEKAVEGEGVPLDWNRTSKVEHEKTLRDLSVLGFFSALGHSTRKFLIRNKITKVNDELSVFLRYLEGACVIMFPELSNLLRYQLFVEVVCKAVDWIPFYPIPEGEDEKGREWDNFGPSVDERMRHRQVAAALSDVEQTCLGWLAAFGNHSRWILEDPESRAAKFVGESMRRFMHHMKTKNGRKYKRRKENEEEWLVIDKSASAALPISESDTRMFEMADIRCQHLYSENCTFCEVEEEDVKESQPGGSEPFSGSPAHGESRSSQEASSLSSLSPTASQQFARLTELSGPRIEPQILPSSSFSASSSLTSNLLESKDSESHLSQISDLSFMTREEKEELGLVGKSMDAIREFSFNVWRGFKLLSSDVVAAAGILQSGVVGSTVTQRQWNLLGRTLKDMALIVPIGILMLIPMTPVGHGAVLAAINQWAPGLIPSCFRMERLEVAQQLENMQRLTLETSDTQLSLPRNQNLQKVLMIAQQPDRNHEIE